MESFEFKIKSFLSQKDYTELSKIKFNFTFKFFVKFGLGLVVGFILLYFHETFSLGVVVIFIILFIITLPHLTKGQTRKEYRRQKDFYYGSEIFINEQFVRIDTGNMKTEIKWNNLRIWDIKNEYLQISFVGIPSIYIKMKSLKHQNVYDDIMKLVKENGVKFNSAEAKKLI